MMKLKRSKITKSCTVDSKTLRARFRRDSRSDSKKKEKKEQIWMRQISEVRPVTHSTSKSSINESLAPGLNNFSFAPFFNECVVKRDTEMEQLFKEAVDTESENFREAIFRFVDKIDNQLSFRNIMSTS